MDALCSRNESELQAYHQPLDPHRPFHDATTTTRDGNTYLSNVMLDAEVPVTVAVRRHGDEGFSRVHPTAIGLLSGEARQLAGDRVDGVDMSTWNLNWRKCDLHPVDGDVAHLDSRGCQVMDIPEALGLHVLGNGEFTPVTRLWRWQLEPGMGRKPWAIWGTHQRGDSPYAAVEEGGVGVGEGVGVGDRHARLEYDRETPFAFLDGNGCVARVFARVCGIPGGIRQDQDQEIDTRPQFSAMGLVGKEIHASSVSTKSTKSTAPDLMAFGPIVPRPFGKHPAMLAVLANAAFAELLGYFMGDGYSCEVGGRVLVKGASYGELKRYGRLLATFFPQVAFTLDRVAKRLTDAPCELVADGVRQGQYTVTARMRGRKRRGKRCFHQVVVDAVERLEPSAASRLVKLDLCAEPLHPLPLSAFWDDKTPWEEDWWCGGGEEKPSVRLMARLLRAWTYDGHGNRVYPVELLNAPVAVRVALWHGLWVADGSKTFGYHRVNQKSLVSAWHIVQLWKSLGVPGVVMAGTRRGYRDLAYGYFYTENKFVLCPRMKAASATIKESSGFVDLPHGLLKAADKANNNANNKTNNSRVIDLYGIQTRSGFVSIGVASGCDEEGDVDVVGDGLGVRFADDDADVDADVAGGSIIADHVGVHSVDADLPEDVVVRIVGDIVGGTFETLDEAVLGALQAVASMSSEGLCDLVRKLAPHVAPQGHPGVDLVLLAAIDRLYSIWDVGEAEGGCLEPLDVVAALASSTYGDVAEVLRNRIAVSSAADDETHRAENVYLRPEGRWNSFRDVLDMQIKAGAGKPQRKRRRSSSGELVSKDTKAVIRAAKRQKDETQRQELSLLPSGPGGTCIRLAARSWYIRKKHRVKDGRPVFRHSVETEYLDCLMAMRYVLRRYEVAFRGKEGLYLSTGEDLDSVQHFVDTYDASVTYHNGRLPLWVRGSPRTDEAWHRARCLLGQISGAVGKGVRGGRLPKVEEWSDPAGRLAEFVRKCLDEFVGGFYGPNAWRVMPEV